MSRHRTKDRQAPVDERVPVGLLTDAGRLDQLWGLYFFNSAIPTSEMEALPEVITIRISLAVVPLNR